MKYEGRVWKFGDDVDTDLIIPARYCNVSDGASLAKHAFADGRPELTPPYPWAMSSPGNEIRLRIVPGTCPHRDQGGGGPRPHREKFCQDLLPQRLQHRPAASRVGRGRRGHPGRRSALRRSRHGPDREPHAQKVLQRPPDSALHGAPHQGRRARGAHPQGKASETALAFNPLRCCPRRS